MPRICTLRALASLCLLVVAAPLAAQQGEPAARYIRSSETAALGLPFSDAVRVGNMLYLSGMIGIRPGTMQLVPGGLEAETRQIFESMRALLEANGSGLDRVVKCTVMLADMEEWPRFNAVYAEQFTENLPARSAFGADGLALDARVELECWALAGAQR